MKNKIKSDLKIYETLLAEYKRALERVEDSGNDWAIGFYKGQIKSYEFVIERLRKLLEEV